MFLSFLRDISEKIWIFFIQGFYFGIEKQPPKVCPCASLFTVDCQIRFTWIRWVRSG